MLYLFSFVCNRASSAGKLLHWIITLLRDAKRYKFSLGIVLIRRLKVTHRAMERAVLGVSLRDRISNEDIRKLTKELLNIVAVRNWLYLERMPLREFELLFKMLVKIEDRYLVLHWFCYTLESQGNWNDGLINYPESRYSEFHVLYQFVEHMIDG